MRRNKRQLPFAVAAFAAAAGIMVSAGTASAATFEVEKKVNSDCSASQKGVRSQAYSHIAGGYNGSTNKLTNVKATFSATNYKCKGHARVKFGKKSQLTGILTVSTTRKLSNCSIGGGVNIGVKDGGGSGTWGCQLNKAKTKGYVGWKGSIAKKGQYGHKLSGFQAKYNGSGEFTGTATTKATGPLGTTTTIANASFGIR